MTGMISSKSDCSGDHPYERQTVLRVQQGKLTVTGLAERESNTYKPPLVLPPVIILIDSRPLTRHSISHLLEQHLSEVKVIAFATADQLLEIDPNESCEVRLIILNIGAVDLRKDEFLHELHILRVRLPDVPVIVFADHSHLEDVKDALRQGIRGYVPTSLDPSAAISALRFVQAGGTYVPESVLLQMLQHEAVAADVVAPTTPQLLDFTPRQSEVLKLLREGKSNKVIARELDMQESTVKVHLRQIMRKLNARNRTQAVIIASALDRAEAGA